MKMGNPCKLCHNNTCAWENKIVKIMENKNVSDTATSRTTNLAVSDGTAISPSTTGHSVSTDKRCSVSVSITDSVSASAEEGSGSAGSTGGVSSTSPGRVPKKFINTWKHACDKTKDRTKDLFKRWRTLPETSPEAGSVVNTEEQHDCTPTSTTNHGWSVHVWATWVKRYPSDDAENMFGDENVIDSNNITDNVKFLTTVQKEKLNHWFAQLLDMDRDDLISIQDFDAFCERLRRFADWTENSPEFVVLQQVKEGFIDHFILSQHAIDKDIVNKKPQLQVITLEEWFGHWGKLLSNARNLNDFPVWLQCLPKILFQAINTSGSGIITRNELSIFYSSMLGLTTKQLNELLEKAYKALTANGEHPLTYSLYRLSFANFLLGRYPNGPGEYIYGHVSKPVECFPIDYSAMNTPPDQLEQYTPDKSSNRRSVIV